jgi:hypothetical protein
MVEKYVMKGKDQVNQFLNKLPADAASKLAAMPFEPVLNQVITDVQAQ